MSLTLRTEADVSQLIKDLRGHSDAVSDMQVAQDLPDHVFTVAAANGLTVTRSELLLIFAERIKTLDLRLSNKGIAIALDTVA